MCNFICECVLPRIGYYKERVEVFGKLRQVLMDDWYENVIGIDLKDKYILPK